MFVNEKIVWNLVPDGPMGGEEIGFIEITGEKCGLSDIFRTFV